MATTSNTYVGNGSTVLYSFTFPYLEESDIYVSVDRVNTTEYTLANATTIEFDTAPANNTVVRIYRTTDIEDLLATFYPGSAIRAQDLNDDYTQTLYIAQELTERAIFSDGSNAMEADLDLGGFDVFNGGARFNKRVDMGGKRIINLANPEESQDAVNYAFLVDAIGGVNPNFSGSATTRFYYTAIGGETTLTSGTAGVPTFELASGKELLYVNGAALSVGIDYDINIQGTQIILNLPLLEGDLIQAISYNFAPVDGNNPSNFTGLATDRLIYTATGGETVITSGSGAVFGLSPGKEILTLNGAVLVSSEDYTLNAQGTQITFTEPLIANDVIQAIAYNYAPVGDVYLRSPNGTNFLLQVTNNGTLFTSQI